MDKVELSSYWDMQCHGWHCHFREFDYPMVVQHADLIVDARNATRGLAAPAGRIIRL
jgi:hypothetical protein